MPIHEYSKIGSSNSTVGAVNFAENQAANTLNDSARELMADNKKWYDDQSGSLTTTGASNVYVLSTNSIVTGTTLATGIRVSFKANFTNTGAATINVSGKGAKAIRKFTKAGEVDIAANDIVQNGRYDIIYDSTANSAAGAWILLNPSNENDIVGDATFSAKVSVGTQAKINSNAYFDNITYPVELSIGKSTNGSTIALAGPANTYVYGSAGAEFQINGADGNLYIGSYSGDIVTRLQGGTEALRIQYATGNVGIGTSTPAYKVDINGSFGATSANIDPNYFLSIVSSKPRLTFDSTDFIEYDRTNNAYSFNVGGTSVATVNNTGFVTPVKAWVNFNGSTGAIVSSFNVSSITRNAAGDYTINFATALADANYAYVATVRNNPATGSGGNAQVVGHSTVAPTASALRIQSGVPTTGSLQDYTQINVVVLR